VIDLHCHILPALDDGAIDVSDSIAMARQAEADGIEIVCATPHIRSDHDVQVGELEGRIEAVNRELERQEVPVRVAPGGEVADEALHEVPDERLRMVSLGRTGVWLLIEPRPGPITRDLIETVERLRDRNFQCVIAHPERHAGADFRERLEALVERGGVDGCGNAQNCVQVCPKEIPLTTSIADMNGQTTRHALASIFRR
jgi:protein-tyrosine phosphatase